MSGSQVQRADAQNQSCVYHQSPQTSFCADLSPTITIFQAGQIRAVPRLKCENICRFINRQNGIRKKHFNLFGPQSINVKGLARRNALAVPPPAPGKSIHLCNGALRPLPAQRGCCIRGCVGNAKAPHRRDVLDKSTSAIFGITSPAR